MQDVNRMLQNPSPEAAQILQPLVSLSAPAANDTTPIIHLHHHHLQGYHGN